MSEECYRLLAEHLDRLPGGFPPSETGAEIKVLKRLFTPGEAALAVHLTLDREEPSVIAGRSGLPEEAAGVMLAAMAHKGLIFSAVDPDAGPLYQAVPFVVGIWEFQVDRLTEDLVREVNEYWSTIKRRRPVRTITQMRTIPIGESITPELESLPYEQVGKLIASAASIAVANCICRREARLEGEGCDSLEEACLMFDEWADYYVREGKGRAITAGEAMGILETANEQGLILQPNNSRDAAFICCCCDCCCGVLSRLKRHPKPAEFVVSRFIASFDPDTCVSCGVCMERCGMDAFSLEDGKVRFDSIRCIGCGLCVTTCPAGALTLSRKPETPRHEVPKTYAETWRRIESDQARAAGEGP